ncbi:hypothetical protein ACO22_04011 [Paracoccidioides brasiliensis]|uniref:Vacuolar ATPase assembly protein VMA22 n=1 Tax=Paracoccidioides brasiliensis TaxID=121759 RepID=A0A1D2JEB9_PARBR|nr:hypothetical protein ACO22_04011 [Paracoccidioides brasiliensis]
MVHLPTPPATPALEGDPEELSSQDTSYVELSRKLDSVLEHYLFLLDQQQLLHEEIGRQFSAGFFSLARANRSCPPGRRYGEDYYDERMKAMRKLSISPPSTIEFLQNSPDATSNQTGSNPTFVIKNVFLPSSPAKGVDKGDPESQNDEKGSSTSSPSRSSSLDPPGISEEPQQPSSNAPPPQSPNPLNWFGILVPTALRSAQQTFSEVVEGAIPALANVITEMREVEKKVEALRALLLAREAAEGGSREG